MSQVVWYAPLTPDPNGDFMEYTAHWARFTVADHVTEVALPPSVQLIDSEKLVAMQEEIVRLKNQLDVCSQVMIGAKRQRDRFHGHLTDMRDRLSQALFETKNAIDDGRKDKGGPNG